MNFSHPTATITTAAAVALTHRIITAVAVNKNKEI
jgi:hypothetical protein